MNEGKIQTGADDGCLRCMDLVNYWKSTKKHTTGCPGAFKTNDVIMSPNDIGLATFPKRDNIEAYENAALNAASAISVIDAAVDVAVSASDAIADEIQFNNGIPNSLNEDLSI